MGRHRGDTRPAGQVSVAAVVMRFTLAGLLAMALLALATALMSRRTGTEQAVDDARRVTWVTGKGVVEPNLSAELLAGDPAAITDFDELMHSVVIRGSLVRVKLWAEDGTIVYSDQAPLIGERFALGDDELALLATGRGTVAEISDVSAPENTFEASSERLLEAYTVVTAADGRPMLFETYFLYQEVIDAGRTQWLRFAPIALGALLALQLVQVPLAWSMARRLERGQRDRERLLAHAVDASDVERRRIASDLHDGVVQDLTGVSYSLAAEVRRNPNGSPELADAAARIRESIGSLRSLLVEIYPPNLAEAGLEAALSDLGARLRNRGIVVDVDVRLDTEPDERAAALVYRGAQEALRNIVAHANATEVVVTVFERDGRLELEVEDDGNGFELDALYSRPDEGHVGLRVLGDLVADAGGVVRLESAPGLGTRLQMEVPAA
ncbi:MAG: histidine kinase [Acidimicrobiia bacterium]|nr:histidine kinase [Acidimicrobiia bacterium]